MILRVRIFRIFDAEEMSHADIAERVNNVFYKDEALTLKNFKASKMFKTLEASQENG